MSNLKAKSRPARNVEHAVAYRRENEFASHPYVRGFWETAAGHLICNFSLTTVDYHGDPNNLAHISLVRSAGGRRGVTIRSEDRGHHDHDRHHGAVHRQPDQSVCDTGLFAGAIGLLTRCT